MKRLPHEFDFQKQMVVLYDEPLNLMAYLAAEMELVFPQKL
jgi:hypothetical protein